MQGADTAEAISEWAGEVLVGLSDPLVPLPPDATISVRAVGLVHHDPVTADGQPDHWVETQHYELVVGFRAHEPDETVRALPWRLREAMKQDTTLRGHVRHASIELNEDDPEDHERLRPERVGDRLVVTVPLVVTLARGVDA